MQHKQILIFIGILCVTMLSTANNWGVIETSEARYAEISREMLRSGDWLHPTLLNIYHFHKPPVTYWITAASFHVFGVNAFGARFPLAIAYGIQVFLIFRLAGELFRDKRSSVFATLVFATLPIVLISARGLTTDAFLTTFILLSVYWWIRFLRTGRKIFLYSMSVAIGLAFMTKGPVAFVLPAFAIAGTWNWYKRPATSTWQVCLTVLIFITVGCSWFIFLVTEDVRFADYFIFRHVVDRIAHAEVFGRNGPWYYYLLVIPATFLPWIAFFNGAFVKHSATSEHDQKKAKKLAVWLFLLPLIFFSSASSKLVLYILPLSIGFSLVVGHLLATGVRKQMLYVFSGLISLIYIGLMTIPLFDAKFSVDRTLFILPLSALLVSPATLLLNVSSSRVIMISSTLFSVSMIVFSAEFFSINSLQVKTITPVSSFISQNSLSERNILVYDELLPSLAFELDKDIITLYAGNHSLKRETQFQKNDAWKNFFVDLTVPGGREKMQRMISKKSVLIVKQNSRAKLDPIVGAHWHQETFGKWYVYYN